MATDVVKFLSGDNSIAKNTEPTAAGLSDYVSLESGQILFGLTRKNDGTFYGTIWYDYYDSKYNKIQRIPMGGGNNSGGGSVAGTFYIADKEGHKGDFVIVSDSDEATLLLPKHICAEYFNADQSFLTTHENLLAGHSYQYGNGIIFVHPFEQDQEGWIRVLGSSGNKNTELEIATRDAYSSDYKNDKIIVRQYDKDGNVIVDTDKTYDEDGNELSSESYKREIILLGTSGESQFPGKVTSLRGFVGNLEGNADTATNAKNDEAGNDIQSTYLHIVELVKSDGSSFIFQGLTEDGTEQNKISIPLADKDIAGLISDSTQTIYGIKTFADDITFPEIKPSKDTEGSEIYPSKSKGISWINSNNAAKIYYELESNDNGMLIIESGKNTKDGVIFRNSSDGKEVKIIDGTIYGNFDGTITNAIMDQSNNIIDDHYFCYFEFSSNDKEFYLRGMPDTGTERDCHEIIQNGTVVKETSKPIKITIPNADINFAGLITADKENAQTITGKKILNEDGELEIQKNSGFNYSGIEESESDFSMPVWFSHGSELTPGEGDEEDLITLHTGVPVYSNDFTYNANTKTLTVPYMNGLASNATADEDGNDIRDHYFCYFETESTGDTYWFRGMPHTGTERDCHQIIEDGKIIDETDKEIKIIIPNAGVSSAGLITNTIQTIAGEKTLTDNLFFSNYIDVNIAETEDSEAKISPFGTNLRGVYGILGDINGWRIAGGAKDNGEGEYVGYLEIATNKDGCEPIYVRQYIDKNEVKSALSFKEIYRTLTLLDSNGATGLYTLSIRDDATPLSADSPYITYIKSEKISADTAQRKSIFFGNIINSSNTVYFSTDDGNSTGLYYINDADNSDSAFKSTIVKNGDKFQTFYAQLRSLYLEDDLYTGKGILNDGPLFNHGSAHLHDISFNHFFSYADSEDIEVGTLVTTESTDASASSSLILTLGNDLKVGETGNAQGYLRIYGPGSETSESTFGDLFFDDKYFRPSHDIYFTNNYDKASGWSNGILGKVGSTDWWHVGGGATADNVGYLEIATSNNTTEPIYVRQYGNENKTEDGDFFVNCYRTAALLDPNGNTYFPQSLGINQVKSDNGRYGLSLYGDVSNEVEPDYGIIFRPILGDTHGYVKNETSFKWAQYFNLKASGAPNASGWVFKNDSICVSSIDYEGNATFNQICLNRYNDTSTSSPKYKHGRISWCDPDYYTWYDYVSEPTSGYAPTSGKPSSIGNIDKLARRWLIENNEGNGWIWESSLNSPSENPKAWLGLSSYDGRLIMAGTEIYYSGSKNTSSMIRWIDNISDTAGNGIEIGGGGVIIIGSGNSATDKNFAFLTKDGSLTTSADDSYLYLLSDNEIYLESNAKTFKNRLGLHIDIDGNLLPVAAEREFDLGQNIGSSSDRWANIYTNVLRLQGPVSKPSKDAGARIEFTYDDVNDRVKPVYISYTADNTYCPPYGLKIWGGDGDANGAWLEVEGAIGLSIDDGKTGIGYSLCNGPSNTVPEYGIFYGDTSETYFDTFGDISGLNAFFLKIADEETEGWIFRRGDTNVASISGKGILTTNIISSPEGWFGNNYLAENYHRWYLNSGTAEEKELFGEISVDLNGDGAMNFSRPNGGYFSFNSYLSIPVIVSDWLSGQKDTNAGISFEDALDTGSYWPWMRMKNSSSEKYFSQGIENTSFYWIGSSINRTDNGYDAFLRFDVTNGDYEGTRFKFDMNGLYVYAGHLRTYNNYGWYNETYGGGWYMNNLTTDEGLSTEATDAWIYSYNSKSLYLGTGKFRTNLYAVGGTYIKASHNGAFEVRASTPEAAGSYIQSWFSGKTSSGAWGVGAEAGSNDMYFIFGSDTNYNAESNDTNKIKFGSDGTVWCAVWNDYAEYRKSEEQEPGRVVLEDVTGTCQKTTKRLQPFAGVVSDTFGFTQGETEDAKTPLAVAGRVLVYAYQDRYNYHVGDCVCAAPNGTVDIMTRDEVIMWPDRIVGTVSEIPEYEEWGSGHVKVNDRIWIKVK